MRNWYGTWRGMLTLMVSALLMAALAACEKKEDSSYVPIRPPAASTQSASAGELRIVSLAPAITQMVIDMGKTASLVGISENDDAAPAGLPVVGNFVDINTESLLSTKPTHVIMMAGKSGAPARLRELAQAGKFKLVAYSYPAKISDVVAIAAGIPTPPADGSVELGRAINCEIEATDAVTKMMTQITAIKTLFAKQASPRRVLIVIGTNPVMASGNHTVLNELLVGAGGLNVASEERVSAPTFDKEKLRALAPEVVVLVMPGAPPLKSIDEDSRLAEFRGLDIPAVKNNRVVLINDPLSLLPATQLGRISGLMAKAVWPEMSDKIDEAMQAKTSATTQPKGSN